MTSETNTLPHVVICTGAGIGHLVPFFRLAAMLANTNTCTVTIIVNKPTMSTAETIQIGTFFDTHPHIKKYELDTLPPDTSDDPNLGDAFFRKYDAVNRSSHLLPDHITAFSPRPSVVFFDILVASGGIKPLADLGIPSFVLIVTSARFFSLMVSLLDGPIVKGKDIILPGNAPILTDEPPNMMYKSEHTFVRLITTNVSEFCHAKGILINTFEALEPDAISALRTGKILKGLPPLYPIGPLHRLKVEKKEESKFISWLDDQPANSVLFVCFGSRTAFGKEQIKELGEGLKMTGLRFLWVIKTTIVDKDDKEDLNNLLGEEFFETTKDRALILKEWVDQEEILAHPSIGWFLTHNGWNSVLESTRKGIPLLAWPPGGDQRVNAALMKDAGLGIWERRWGFEGEFIKADEIKDKIMELVSSDEFKVSVKKVSDEARKAWEIDGSSRKMFQSVVDTFAKTSKENLINLKDDLQGDSHFFVLSS